MPRGVYGVHSLLEGPGPSACNDDRGAELAQAYGYLPAQPRTAARDEGYASRKVVWVSHFSSLKHAG